MPPWSIESVAKKAVMHKMVDSVTNKIENTLIIEIEETLAGMTDIFNMSEMVWYSGRALLKWRYFEKAVNEKAELWEVVVAPDVHGIPPCSYKS